MKVLTIALLSLILAGCKHMPPFTGPKGLEANPYIVEIHWKTTPACEVDFITEDPAAPTTCLITGPGICIGRNDWVFWRSNNPSDADFEIFFDPIDGIPLKTIWDGIAFAPIDDDAPLGQYKYSIVREGCDPNIDNTFDPHIRVDR